MEEMVLLTIVTRLTEPALTNSFVMQTLSNV